MSDLSPGLEPIAIVGMALRVPGAEEPETLWRNLMAGVESITRLTEADLRAAGVGQAALADPRYVRAGALLEGIERMNEARSADYDSARERVAALQEKLDFVGGPGSAVHALVGTQAVPQAGARVFLDPVTGRAILFAYDLPVLSVDQLYELWAIGPAGPRPAGVFRPDDSGRARLEIEDPDLLRNVQVLAVTVEPAPGTERPTGEIILSSGRS